MAPAEAGTLATRSSHSTPAATRTGTGPAPGRLLAGVAWALLLLGLWLWGRDLPGGMAAQLATTGDVAAVGRPLGRHGPPHAHAPVPASAAVKPSRISIDALGVRAAAIVERGLDENGTLTPSPETSPETSPDSSSDTSPGLVGWYGGGPRPGEAGAALLAAPAAPTTAAGADADVGRPAQRAVFHSLAGIKPGQRVEIQRSDGSTVRFVIEDVQLHDRAHFDARKAYAAREPGRSELRLISESGSRGREGRGGDGTVVVISAYLTSYQAAAPPGPSGRTGHG
ncbi:class F sortase [Streptomyces inhibens]|uniref:class F sortase n=1 Tax=Streptomyces inhibens TaxID=2293571 RepID=UPI001EE75845|nr:class F sortase [Streptomyces inhibens]UKY50440.1 class F sortase [Streptomyces inhibens]